MYIERKQDLSVYYWLKDLFATYTFVSVNDGYPNTNLTLPAIAVESQDIVLTNKEMGNRISNRTRYWDIEVFGSNKAQRDEFVSMILNNIENGISVYDYDEGFPPGISPTEIGLLSLITISVKPIRIFPELVEKMYWRTTITISTEYNIK